ncbi:MAG: NADPH-dependent FMN reductase [Bacteroidia bacterium]|nr:NAD(P)H-dependent oxidoreductase [Bacteroidia bacterium]MDW8015157.1 NADPH-dependent FMN reductase [Bacteroidia bacterium]
MPIAILSATHRPHSYTRRIALYVARRLEAKDYTYQFIDFQALPREFLFSDLFGERSERFLPMIEALAQCSSWIWVVPEYNGSFPGVVKVFIDALPREVFRGKRAGLIGVSDGRFGNLRGLEHLMGILHYCGMEVAPFRAHLMRIQSHWNEEEGRPASVLEEEIETFLERFLPAPITA